MAKPVAVGEAGGSWTGRRKAYGGHCGTRRGGVIVQAEQEGVSAIASSPDAHRGSWEARSRWLPCGRVSLRPAFLKQVLMAERWPEGDLEMQTALRAGGGK